MRCSERTSSKAATPIAIHAAAPIVNRNAGDRILRWRVPRHTLAYNAHLATRSHHEHESSVVSGFSRTVARAPFDEPRRAITVRLKLLPLCLCASVVLLGQQPG